TLGAVVAPAARRARLASSVALGSRAGSTWPVSDGLPVAAVGGVGFPAVAASPDDVETGTDDGTASSASALSSTSCRSAAYSGARTISWAHQPPARARTTLAAQASGRVQGRRGRGVVAALPASPRAAEHDVERRDLHADRRRVVEDRARTV